MIEGILTKTVILKASPTTVWEFLTQSDRLRQWFHESNRDLAQGEEYQLLDDNNKSPLCWGKVLEFRPPHRLVYSFTHNYLKGRETTVTWELRPVAGGTQLELTHAGLKESDAPLAMLLDHDKGWDEHFGRLRNRVQE